MAEERQEKQEPLDEAVTSAEAGEVYVPYSIYSNKEKWMIVGMVALAGFYRYVYSLLCAPVRRSGFCCCQVMTLMMLVAGHLQSVVWC
jgi:hypothetical protein